MTAAQTKPLTECRRGRSLGRVWLCYAAWLPCAAWLSCAVWLPSITLAADVTPLDAEFETAKWQLVTPPAGNGEYGRYRLWLPKVYYESARSGRSYPMLFIDACHATPKIVGEKFDEWLTKNAWIGVSAVDMLPGNTDANSNKRHYNAILKDLETRLLVAHEASIIFGYSWGSCRAADLTMARPDLFGGMVQNSAVTGSETKGAHLRRTDLMVAIHMGNRGPKLHEIGSAANKINPARLRVQLFKGEHWMGPRWLQEESLDWIAAGLLSRRSPDGPALDLLVRLHGELKAGTEGIPRYLKLSYFKQVYDAHSAFKRINSLKKVAEEYDRELRSLKRDREFKTELKAMADWERVRDQYIAVGVGTALKKKGAVKKVAGGAIAQALAALDEIIAKHPESYAATLAKRDRRVLGVYEDVRIYQPDN